MIKQILSTLFFLIVGGATAEAGPAFAVAPGYVQVDLDHPETQTFLIRNKGDERIHLRVKPMFFAVDSSSLKAGQVLNPAHKDQFNLAPYLLISPQAIVLEPGEQRIVRVSVRAPSSLPQGSYWGHVLVHMFEVYQQVNTKSAKSGVGTQLNLLMEMAVAVHAKKGQGSAVLQALCHKDTKGNSIISFKNSTNWCFRGHVSMALEGRKSKELHLVVYPQSIRSVALPALGTTVTWLDQGEPENHRIVCQ
jgi:P pilus assembly chaperone PapD